MSIYLKDDTVVIKDGSVATSDDCCCITGACCLDGECTITTETNCEGTYQGDDTTCDPNPCFNCGNDSVGLCKCGFAAYDGSGTYYLTQIKELYQIEHSDPPPTGGCDAFYDIFTTLTYTLDGFGNCSGPGHTCSGGGTGTYGTCVPLFISSLDICVPTGLGCDCFGTPLGPTCSIPPPATSATNEYCEVSYSQPGNNTQHQIFNFNLSDEYTTAMLIANATALWNATYVACPEGCELTHTLNGDESCVTIFCVPA